MTKIRWVKIPIELKIYKKEISYIEIYKLIKFQVCNLLLG